MKEYQVKLDSLHKLLEFRRIIRRYKLKGRLTQKNFSAGLHPILLAPVLPLYEAQVVIYRSQCPSSDQLDADMRRLAG